jgi:hypothetical protein
MEGNQLKKIDGSGVPTLEKLSLDQRISILKQAVELSKDRVINDVEGTYKTMVSIVLGSDSDSA